MRDRENIEQILTLKPDMLGFIFYPKSQRYVDKSTAINKIAYPDDLVKVGVFVDAEIHEIEEKVRDYNLQAVQLHGHETADFCRSLQKQGLLVIKAFPIDEHVDFQSLAAYQDVVDYFLFDTKTDVYGGSGLQFNWNLLNQYQGEKPFIISGGIAVDDAVKINALEHPKLMGVDLNSRFETAPAYKDFELVRQFFHALQNK